MSDFSDEDDDDDGRDFDPLLLDALLPPEAELPDLLKMMNFLLMMPDRSILT